MLPKLFILMTMIGLSVAFGGSLHALLDNRIRTSRRIERYLSPQSEIGVIIPEPRPRSLLSGRLRLVKRIVGPLSHVLQQWFDHGMSAKSKRILEQQLRDAGSPLELTPVTLRLLQVSLFLGCFLLVFILLKPQEAGHYGRLFAISLGIAGYVGVYPSLYLSSKQKKRMKAIQQSMADFFDTVCLSMEAGMGLDAAIAKVCLKMPGPLSSEFLLTLEEMKLGVTRREAFSHLRERVKLEDFSSVIGMLIQADHLGIGMSHVMKTLTKQIRYKRRESAREQAMKAPVKMMLPMVGFIFPSMFIVLLGPLMVLLITQGL